jgi:glycosyltransferase involved in cell wall biosynthesis
MVVVFDARGATRYRGTGIGTYTYQLTLALAATGAANDTLVVCIAPEAGSDLTEAISQASPSCTVKARRLASADRDDESEEIAAICAGEGGDVLHMPQNGRGMPTVACRVVSTIHDLIPLVLPQTCSPSYLSDCVRQMRWISMRSDRIIAVSRHTATQLHEVLAVPLTKIAVVHEAPEPAYAMPMRECEIHRVGSAHNLPDNFILATGGCSPRKNLGVLVEALHLVRQEARHHGWQPPDLVITGRGGDGDGAAELMDLAARYGIESALHIAGVVPAGDLPATYAKALVLACPSLHEGFSLPVVEAMATGTPVVASDIGAHREIAGDAVAYVDFAAPCAVEGLGRALAQSIWDQPLRQVMIAAGHQRVRRYSWWRAARETWLVYRWAVT